MPSITRLFATTALTLSLIAGPTSTVAAPSSLMPRADTQSAHSADAVLANSARYDAVECPTATPSDHQQRADRLATLMMRHAMVSRPVPGRDIAESANAALPTGPAQSRDDAPRNCG